MENQSNLLKLLEEAFLNGKIPEVRVRKAGNLLVAEITADDMALPGSATATFPQENIVRYTLAVALDQLDIHTPDAKEAKGKVLPFYGKFPL